MDKPVSQMTPNEWTLHNQEQRILDNMERSQTYVAMPRPQASAPGSAQRQQYFTPGGFRDAREGVIAGIFAPVIYACYIAAVRQGASYPKALGHALSVVWQWKAWGFTVFYWFASLVGLIWWKGYVAKLGDPATGYTTGQDVTFQTRLIVLHILLAVIAIGVPYCQAVDASFFKQRTAYLVLRPVHRAIGWMPWFVLQSLVLLPLLIIIQYRW